LPFEALFVPDELRSAVSDRAWLEAMLDAERALAVVQARARLIPELRGDVFAADGLDVEELARDARAGGNPVEPLVRRLRARSEHAHHGATSQDVLDTAAMLVARSARALVLREVDGLAAACAALAEQHRETVMAARTLLQQAVPTTFGLKAAVWLDGVVPARARLADVSLPAELGGAAGTLASLGDRGVEVLEAYAAELGLDAPAVPWHATRFPVRDLGAALDLVAGACAKVAVDVELLAQTEVAEVREPAPGGSSTMPHKRNPVGSTLARACAAGAHAAAGVLTGGVHEHERAAGAWHAEWKALSDALALTGGAAWWVRQTLEGLDVDVERMRANIRDDTLSEADRLGGADRPGDYLGSAGAFVDRALDLYRSLTEPGPGPGSVKT
jgi:3-carboxy-cis,cis-muconate cycloisomerase